MVHQLLIINVEVSSKLMPFFHNKSSSNGTYYASCGLVETFLIDAAVLRSLLSDEKISRSIYNELAVHVITNNYQSLVHLTRPQLKAFLNEKAIFYKNQSNLTIELQPNQRLLLLSGTISCYSSNDQ
ncbi:unnamed protein product [Adineta ricciae]|uniref:Uncharacterized protein n=1 Tax=Adineta ricciae TaxID=249248 RepID=A0A816GQH2_ADIRI|nr:unnamed protein product [Adineta ricciae]CAF1677044.1 unnamed protein product [Adineta ricciae]